MKTLLLIAIMMIVDRPPAPSDVPFEFDPNMVTSEVLIWYIAEPNVTFAFTVGAHNRWGLQTELSASDCYDSNTPILIDRGPKQKDPEGGWNQFFNVLVTPRSEGVHYIDLVCEDKVGRQDKRTLLVLCVADDTPFIFVEVPPTITVAEAQRTWQVAKKIGYPATSPTNRK